MSMEDSNAEERGVPVTGSEGTTSPRVSSAISGTEVRRANTGGNLVDAAAPGLDTHHWAGVRRGPREGDARSVASSLAAEKDALSVYDNQESDLEGEGRDDEGIKSSAVAEEDEMDLNQEEEAGGLAPEPSVMEEGSLALPRGTPISELGVAGPLLAERDGDGSQSAAGTMSPPLADVPIPVPAGGMALSSAPVIGGMGDSLQGDGASTVGAVDGTDRASDVASLDLASASAAASPRRVHTEDGEEEGLTHPADASSDAHEAIGEPAGDGKDGDHDKTVLISGDVNESEVEIMGADAEDSSPAADNDQDEPRQPAVVVDDGKIQEEEPQAAAPAPTVTPPVAEESSETFAAANENATVRRRSLPAARESGGEAEEVEVARRGLAMQALVEGKSQELAPAVAGGGQGEVAEVDGEEELTVYSSGHTNSVTGSRRMEPLETEGPPPGSSAAGGGWPVSVAAAGTAAAGSSASPASNDPAAAPLDIRDASQAPPGTAVLPEEYAPAWESMFQGLVYCDGVDSLGRPVVVLDADAVPAGMKASAARYVTAHLTPLVERGDYVLVLTARRAALPSMWIMGAYTTLPRPFRKNVKLIVLVRPTGFLRAILALLRPLMSAKAAKKLRMVDSLREIGAATEGQVEVTQLGAAFLASPDARAELEGAAEPGEPGAAATPAATAPSAEA